MDSVSDWNVEAILDKPSPEIMGVHGLLLASPDKDYFKISGINSARFRDTVFEEHELYYLVGRGATRASIVLELGDVKIPEQMSDVPSHEIAGLYVGNVFRQKAKSYDLEVGPLRKQDAPIAVPDGTLEIDTTSSLYTFLDNWLTEALKTVVASPNENVAQLMSRCDSLSIKSQTARWLSAPDEITRSKDLDWVLRLSEDGGWGLASSRDELIESYQQTIDAL